jgi:hypothetical protein
MNIVANDDEQRKGGEGGEGRGGGEGGEGGEKNVVAVESTETTTTTVTTTTTTTLTVVYFSENAFYNANDLKKNNPHFFKGTSITIRDILKKKDIPERDRLFATKTKKGWNLSDSNSKKANLFISKTWADINILFTVPPPALPMLSKESTIPFPADPYGTTTPPRPSTKKSQQKEKKAKAKATTATAAATTTSPLPHPAGMKKAATIATTTIIADTDDISGNIASAAAADEIVTDSDDEDVNRKLSVVPMIKNTSAGGAGEPIYNRNNVPRAPPILILQDAQKFRDTNNVIQEIEVRGEYHPKRIYFNVLDVGRAFGLPSINGTLSSVNGNYVRNHDFKKFWVQNENNYNGKEFLFLTYEGLLCILFRCNHENALHYRMWALERLFVVQFGSPFQKEELAAELLHINRSHIRKCVDMFNNNTPIAFLIRIGQVSEINKVHPLEMNATIQDSYSVFSYGITYGVHTIMDIIDAHFAKPCHIGVSYLLHWVRLDSNCFTAAEEFFDSEILKTNCIVRTPNAPSELKLFAVETDDTANETFLRELFVKIEENFNGVKRRVKTLEREILEKDHTIEVLQLKMDIQSAQIETRTAQMATMESEIKMLKLEARTAFLEAQLKMTNV